MVIRMKGLKHGARKMRPYGVERRWCRQEDSMSSKTGCRTRPDSKVRARRAFKKRHRLKVKRAIANLVYGSGLSTRDLIRSETQVK